MEAALRQLSDLIDDATQRVLSTARAAADSQLREPSLLPGWTRGHVLSHLARNADALRNLLIGARSGEQRLAYPSPQAREAGIEYGAGLPADRLSEELAAAAAALRTICFRLPARAWQFPVRIAGSAPFPAAEVLTRRLVEVELHHCDLGLNYQPEHWLPGFAGLELPAPLRALRQDRLDRPPGPLVEPALAAGRRPAVYRAPRPWTV